MTLAPRFLVNLWAGLCVARLARRLKKPGYDRQAQQQAFAQLVARTAGTEFGRTQGVAAGMSYAQFREKVPPHGADWFQPLVTRMASGEPNVLVPGKCPLFVETAGTTGAMRRLLPAPEALLDHFCAALRDALFLYAHRAGNARIFLGRQLHLGASIAIAEDQGRYRAGIDGLLTLCISPWAEANLRSPAGALAVLPEGPDKTAAIARDMLNRDVTLIGGNPAQLWALVDAVRKAGSAGTHLRRAWPNLQCCVVTGAPLGLHGEMLRLGLGPEVRLHEVYAAAEGFFAAQDGGSPAAMRLITDAGVFFEFLPLESHAETSLDRTGPLCVPVEQVKPGVDYVPVITTPAGLCRYVLDDVVRFVSATPPRLRLVGRVGQRLDAVGERVSAQEVLEAMQAVCARNGWLPTAFHVAPYVQRLGAGMVAHVHEWWLELGTHTVRTPMANVLAPELDAELCQRNRDYALRRAQGILGLPLIRLVMPGVFEHWARKTRRTAGVAKLAPCRSDRVIADQLAAIAPFHQGTIAPFQNTDLT